MDHFESKKFIYLCYEKVVDGVPLKEFIRDIPCEKELDYREIVLQIAQVIDHLHSGGITIRNLTFESFLIKSIEGEASIPMLTNLKYATILGPG